MSNKKWLFIPIAVFILFIAINMISVFIESSKSDVYSIFSNIKECYSFEGYNKIENFDDEYLKELNYENAFVATVKNDDCEFEIFAYEFKTTDDAWNYYKRFCNKDFRKRTNYGYEFATGHSTAQGIVFNNKNLYRVYCESREIDNVMNYLSSVFTLEYKGAEGFNDK